MLPSRLGGGGMAWSCAWTVCACARVCAARACLWNLDGGGSRSACGSENLSEAEAAVGARDQHLIRRHAALEQES